VRDLLTNCVYQKQLQFRTVLSDTCRAGQRIPSPRRGVRQIPGYECGNTDQAIELLKQALDLRQTSPEWVRGDPDLDFIRDDPRFQALVGM